MFREERKTMASLESDALSHPIPATYYYTGQLEQHACKSLFSQRATTSSEVAGLHNLDCQVSEKITAQIKSFAIWPLICS